MCLSGHQPIDRSHHNHRPGGDIADPSRASKLRFSSGGFPGKRADKADAESLTIRPTLGNYPVLGKQAAARFAHAQLMEFPDLGPFTANPGP